MVWLFLLVLVAPAAIFTAAYNRLLTARIALRNAFAQIDVLLTRRYDMLPNLIESLRESLEDEHAVLDALLADCRAARESLMHLAGDPGGNAAVNQLADVDMRLRSALGALQSLLLRHPQLPGSALAAALTEELTATERKVASARQAYNSAVTNYNTGRSGFPGSMAAGFFGFEHACPLPETLQASARAPALRAAAGQTFVASRNVSTDREVPAEEGPPPEHAQ